MKKFEEAIENKTQDKTIIEGYDKEWEWTDLGRQKGRLEGKEEGRIEGREEGKIELIKNMLRADIPMQKIIECTQLEEKQILAIKNTLEES